MGKGLLESLVTRSRLSALLFFTDHVTVAITCISAHT